MAQHAESETGLVSVPLSAAAHKLGVRPDTVRAWLRAGAPTVRRGRRGPGGQALVDLDALERWRRRREPAEAPPPMLVCFDAHRIAEGMLATFNTEEHRKAGLTDPQAATLLLDAWEYAVTACTGRKPALPWPPAITTLYRVLSG